MPKQPGKGSSHARQSVLERKATQHHDFVGGAREERAEAESRKRQHLDEERDHEAVREMADELAQLAGVRPDGAMGPELPFRIPRSIDETTKLIRELPEALREKARERLDQLPEPAKKALEIAESAAQVLLAPVRIGLAVARELWRVPRTMLRIFREA